MSKEKLTNTETKSSKSAGFDVSVRPMNQEQIDALYKARFLELESIKNLVSLKFFYKVEEKLKQEKASLEKLLNLHNKEQEFFGRYSLVLNSHFFEQKFFN